jgi:DNA polymerase-3 subunit delta'
VNETGGAPEALLPLSGIHGHPRTREALARALREGRLYPSLIFHGPEGVGKRTAALAVAAALVCRDPEGLDACGQCVGCRRVREASEVTRLRDGAERRETILHYPDVGFLSPPRSSTGRARTRILVSQVRDLIHSLAKPPFELARRVYILDPAESLSIEAQNALLKTLEEPPPYALLILVTSSLGSLLPTTRSRCQSYPFPPLREEELRRLLLARGRDEPEAATLAALAGGRVGRALALRLEDLRALRETLLEAVEEVVAAAEPGAAAVREAARLLDEEIDARPALDLLGELLRDQMVLEAGRDGEFLVHRESEARLAALATARPDAVERAERLEELRRRLVTVNLNPRMVLEASLLLWS